MPSFIQDLGLVEAVLSDIVSFAEGNPVTKTVDGYTVTLKVLLGGPVAPFTALSGGMLSIITAVFADYVAFATGAPVNIAVKEGATWYGASLSKQIAGPVLTGLPTGPTPAA